MFHAIEKADINNLEAAINAGGILASTKVCCL